MKNMYTLIGTINLLLSNYYSFCELVRDSKNNSILIKENIFLFEEPLTKFFALLQKIEVDKEDWLNIILSEASHMLKEVGEIDLETHSNAITEADKSMELARKEIEDLNEKLLSFYQEKSILMAQKQTLEGQIVLKEDVIKNKENLIKYKGKEIEGYNLALERDISILEEEKRKAEEEYEKEKKILKKILKKRKNYLTIINLHMNKILQIIARD